MAKNKLEREKEILEQYIRGKSAAELLDERPDLSRNKAYRIYARYNVFKDILEANEVVKDLILSVSNSRFKELKAKYKYQGE